MRKKGLVILGVIALLTVAATLLWAAPSFADKLSEAIAQTPQGTGQGMIHPGAPKGFMGIPGGPRISSCFTSCGASGWVGSFRRWAPSGVSWPVWATSPFSGWPIMEKPLRIPAPT